MFPFSINTNNSWTYLCYIWYFFLTKFLEFLKSCLRYLKESHFCSPKNQYYNFYVLPQNKQNISTFWKWRIYRELKRYNLRLSALFLNIDNIYQFFYALCILIQKSSRMKLLIFYYLDNFWIHDHPNIKNKL